MTRNVSVLGALAIMVAWGLTVAPDAGAAVYWTNQAPTSCQGSIGRANLDGSLVDQTFITGADMPNGVAVNATDIYWANTGPCLNSIARASLDGTNVDQSFIAGYPDGPSGPFGVALDGGYLYWANRFGYESIGTADLNGTNVDETFVPSGSQPCAVAVDADHIFWAKSNTGSDPNTIGRANYDGMVMDPGFIQGADSPCGVVVDSTYIYWTNTGGTTIGRANLLDGSQADQSFITGAGAPCGIAVDDHFIYWGNSATGTIGRANLDGTQADQRFITGATRPCGVAVDSLVVTATPPSSMAAPAITGTAAAGQTLTCSQGSWSGSPIKSYAYQWLRDGTASSATDSTYTVPTADVGHTLTCHVTASNIAGHASATSAGVEIATPPASTAAPAIFGTAANRHVLTCSQGSWSGSVPRSYTHQWLRDGTATAAAAISQYVVATTDVGHTLTCRVTARNIAGQASATSAGVRVRVPAPKLSVTAPPRVRGTTVVLTLTCTAAVGRRCTSSEALTTTEHRSGKKVLGISSYGRQTVAKVVTVGRTISSIAAGRSKVIRLGLNARGRALLKRFHKLPGRLTVRLTKGVPRTRVVLSKAVRFNQR